MFYWWKLSPSSISLFLQPYIFLEFFTFTRTVWTNGLFFHGISSSCLLIHGMSNPSRIQDDSTWQRLSVIWFARTETLLIWLVEGLSYLPSLFALYFIFPFCWTIAGISLNMENRTVMRRRRCEWESESNGCMDTKSLERKWGSHFNNVLPTARRVRQIDSLIFFFPEVWPSARFSSVKRIAWISRPSLLAQCYPLFLAFCVGYIMCDIWYASTFMLCFNPFLLHTVTINGVFFTRTHNFAEPLYENSFDLKTSTKLFEFT